MKCWLHIGTEKTGTTSIQAFLGRNARRLDRSGLTYCVEAGYSDHRDLSVAAYRDDRRDDFTQTHKIATNDELKKLQTEIQSKFAQSVGKSSSSRHVFSSEHFQSRLISIEEIERLKQILIGLGFAEFNIIVYLREQVQLAESLYSMSIKNGGTASEPPAPENPYFFNICNHQETIEKFGAVFGIQNVVPRLFEKSEFKNDSLIEDFLNVIGVPFNSKFVIPTLRNKRLSNTGLAILSRVNKRVSESKNAIANSSREIVVDHFEKNFSDTRYKMEESLAKQYELKFKKSNERVRCRYFPDKKKLFRERPMDLSHTGVLDDDQLDRIANTICEIWLESRNEIIPAHDESDRSNPKFLRPKTKNKTVSLFGFGRKG